MHWRVPGLACHVLVHLGGHCPIIEALMQVNALSRSVLPDVGRMVSITWSPSSKVCIY
jgi:hypothetical protein